MAARAFAHDITVGEELVLLFVVELFALQLHEFVVVVEFAEEVRCEFVMCFGSGAAVDVERDTEFLE